MEHTATSITEQKSTGGSVTRIKFLVFFLIAGFSVESVRHLVDDPAVGSLICLAVYMVLAVPCNVYLSRKRHSGQAARP